MAILNLNKNELQNIIKKNETMFQVIEGNGSQFNSSSLKKILTNSPIQVNTISFLITGNF